MIRLIALLALPALLAGCAEPTWVSTAEVQQAVYRPDGPPKITLFTVINNNNNTGAHAALMVSGSQRVVFDPAGTFKHPRLPERNDVVFGMTDRALDTYIDYHTRETYRTVRQEIVVSPEVAELALRRVQDYGAVPKAQCNLAVSRILSDLPGFESVRPAWFPKRTMRSFAALPGVTEQVYRDDDSDDNQTVLAEAEL